MPMFKAEAALMVFKLKNYTVQKQKSTPNLQCIYLEVFTDSQCEIKFVK